MDQDERLRNERFREALDYVNDHSNWHRDVGPEPTREPVEHYGSDSGIECIDAIRAMGAGYDFSRGNAVKYLWRAGRKEGNTALGDLKKARVYLDFMIEELESETGSE